MREGRETREGRFDEREDVLSPDLSGADEFRLPAGEEESVTEFFAVSEAVVEEADGGGGRPDPFAALRRSLERVPRPGPASEAALARAAQAGDVGARNMLVEQHVWLVVAIAKEYESAGLPREDLVQEGIFGVARAVKTFDPSRGTRFATYAKYRVHDEIKQAVVETSRTIGLPRELYRKFFRIRRARNDLVQRLQRNPTSAETGALVDLSAVEVDEVEALFASVVPLELDGDSSDDANDDRSAESATAVPHKTETRPTLEVEERQVDGPGVVAGRYSSTEVDSLLELYPELYPKAARRPAAIVRLIDVDKALRRMPFEHWQTVTHAVMRSCAAIEVAELLVIDRETVTRRRKSAVAWIVQYLNSGDDLPEVAARDLIWRGWFDDSVDLLPVRVNGGSGDAALIPRSLREAKTLCRRRPAAPTGGSGEPQPR